MVLAAVEAYGAVWALQEEGFGHKEEERCNRALPPWDPWLSMKTKSFKRYPSFLDFCYIWFTFNFVFNFVCLLFYYAFIAYRFWLLYHKDRELVVADNNRNSTPTHHL